MKKFILVLILLLSAVIVGTYEIQMVQEMIVTAVPAFAGLYSWVGGMFASLRELVPFLTQALQPWACDVVIYLVLAIAFIIVYSIIFGIIGAIIGKSRKKKFNEAFGGNPVVLTEEQQAKFDYKLYEKRFPTWRLIVILLEIIIVALFVIIRFDLLYTIPSGPYGDGLHLFDEGIIIDEYGAAAVGTQRPTLFTGLLPSLGVVGTTVGYYVALYIINIGALFQGQMIIEIVCIVIATLVLILFTYAIGSIFAGAVRRSKAKKRARKAKEKYVRKLEYQEYKAWVKSQKENRVSEKNRQLYNEEKEVENTVDVKPIANETKVSEDKKVVGQSPEQNYIDDISTGVTDLGLIEEDNNEIQKPLTSRETRFVGDEENDIVLEEEPIIETIEEEESYYNDKVNAIDENFEKYQPETTKDLNIEDKVKKYNIDVIEENTNVEKYKEENTPAIQDFEDREIVGAKLVKDTKSVVEDKVAEEVKPVEVKPIVEEKIVEEVKPVVEEKPLDSKEEFVSEETKVVEEEVEPVVVELIKPKQPVVAARKTVSATKRKPIRPVDVTDEKNSKLAEYIVNTSDSTQLAMSQEELESQVNAPKQTRTKSSALTRNPTNRRKTTSTSKKPTTAKKTTTTKKLVANKPTSAAAAKLEKPSKPVSAE